MDAVSRRRMFEKAAGAAAVFQLTRPALDAQGRAQGYVKVPDTPGIGVELNEAVVRRLCVVPVAHGDKQL
jgi:L-alanine-DL-glutamate epimerase-like enolase superfamily enzyme